MKRKIGVRAMPIGWGRMFGRAFERNGRRRVERPAGAITAPPDADWRWRPEAWHLPAPTSGIAGAEPGNRFGAELSLFHDSQATELTLYQVPNSGDGAAPFGVRIEVSRFDGSFLSLALDLPSAAVTGLTRRHLLGLAIRAGLERSLGLYARLNLRHGPNTERLVREIAAGTADATVEFDLAYCDLNERRIERAWLDLIFEAPVMGRIEIGDLTLYRRLRAEL